MPILTLDVSVGTDDGWVYRIGTTWPPAGAVTVNTNQANFATQHSLFAPDYYRSVGVLRWDTSVLPDGATINSATFQGYADVIDNANSMSICAEWYDPSTIDAPDYTETIAATALASQTIASLGAIGTKTLALANLSSINKTGYTGLRWHIDNTTAPTGANRVSWASFNNATAARRPKLIIDYTDGAGPTPVTYTVTLSATMIGAPSLGRVRTAMRRLSATIATVPVLVTRKTIRKALATVATGVATLARTVTYRRTLATAVIGAATMPASGARQQALSVVMTASATLTRLATFRRILSVTATALPKLSKRMFVRLSSQATVTATLSWARLRTRALAATAGAVVGLTATYAKGTGFVMRRSLWRAYNLFARTKK